MIHSDFQRGFIKAEIVSYDDLVAAGSVAAARAVGKARIEGKDYVMRDGDVVEFRFEVHQATQKQPSGPAEGYGPAAEAASLSSLCRGVGGDRCGQQIPLSGLEIR